MTTGGPEALHQLVSHMVNLGLPAFIVYLPFGNLHQTPAPYLKYNAPIGSYEDAANNLIIFPEIYPMLALKVKSAKAALWWLSLDNFLERKNTSVIRDKYHYIRAVLRGKKPLFGAKELTDITHFSPTKYATDYLKKFGINPIGLNDPVSQIFLNAAYESHQSSKKNLILYNPGKGLKITKKVIRSLPHIEFLPLKGYSQSELSRIMFSAKLYVDFGHFPGGERIPREAAMHGCCVISGKLGSAANDLDFPIPNQYKLNTTSKTFIDSFKTLAEEVLNNFDYHYSNFEDFRIYLKSQPDLFNQQIKNTFIEC